MLSCHQKNRLVALRLTTIVLFLWAYCFGSAGVLLAQNPGVVTIADPSRYEKVAAISDVHGMYDNAVKLLTAGNVIDQNKKWIAGKTLLIVVGDSIDKGPKSLEVLELWMDLQSQANAQSGKVVVLLGNHEAEYLAHPEHEKAKTLHKELKDAGFQADSLTKELFTYHNHALGRFIHDMPVAARVGNYLFCHAGWMPDMTWDAFVTKASNLLNQKKYDDDFLIGFESVLENKFGTQTKTEVDGLGDKAKKWWKRHKDVDRLEKRLKTAGLAGVIFGHQPKAFGLEDNVGPYDETDYRLIKIDSGMAPGGGEDGDNSPGNSGHFLLITRPAMLLDKIDPKHVKSVGVGAH